MHAFKRWLLFISMGWAVAGAAQAQPDRPARDFDNGCGPSGLLGWLVPDQLGSCKFAKSCGKHDNCYSACEKDGVLDGRPECAPRCWEKSSPAYKDESCVALRAARAERKQVCDRNFLADLIAENDGGCESLAGFYTFMVTKVGGGFFNGLKVNDLKKIFDEVRDEKQAELRIRLLLSLNESRAIRAPELVVTDEGHITVPARKSLTTRLKTGDVISIDPDLMLSEKKLQPLLDLQKAPPARE